MSSTSDQFLNMTNLMTRSLIILNRVSILFSMQQNVVNQFLNRYRNFRYEEILSKYAYYVH